MRKARKGTRQIYSVLGMVALLAALCVALPLDLSREMITEGVMSLMVAIACAIGAGIGFLHVRSAGFTYDDDESHQLDRAHRARQS